MSLVVAVLLSIKTNIKVSSFPEKQQQLMFVNTISTRLTSLIDHFFHALIFTQLAFVSQFSTGLFVTLQS